MGRLSRRAFATALVAVAVAAGAAFGAGAVVSQAPDGQAPDPGTGPPLDADTGGAADAGTGPPLDADARESVGNDASATPAERLACTNATSEAVLACGYNPGPTSVSLADQRAPPGTVTVEAVELNEGGFVAIHRVSFVDGAFTESVVGVSRHLPAGLHRDVRVAVEPTAANLTVAVVYRDGDDDGQFDFVATGGATDRPYTNTYTEAEGNVTDEAGDVIGDVANVTTVGRAFDADGDGRIEIGELSDAARAYVNGDISIRRLGRVAAAYSDGT